MPVQTVLAPKEVVEVKKRSSNLDKNVHQTPPPKKKPGKSERASTLCSTPPTCIKDKDSHVEYTRKEFLGEGGFARCYLVTNRQGRPFAAKVVAKASLKTAKAKGKLIGEIKVHQSLQHPNIVRYQECFEDKSNVYIILELCENKSLLEMLRKRKRLSEAEVRFFMLQILGATKYMHEKRVIHRDLKLGNLFLDHKMNVKLGDFGLAALLMDDNERKRTICGTPNYIAPEVLCDNGGGHSYEVDLWSIGVIMYALLVGKPPFQAKDVKVIYKNIKDNIYDFPTQDPISQEARDLITSLLSPDPTHRPSIDEISDHTFFHLGEMPREIPASALVYPPQCPPISKPMSELNWRYVSVQAGLGKNVQVGTDAGKSVQACITSNENPLKNHVTRLREEESGVAKVENVLPTTLSPRVPAPAVGGMAEGRLMGKGAKRSVRKVSSEEDKENLMMDMGRSLKSKGALTKKGATRTAVQHAFEGIPEEPEVDRPKARTRRLAPPSRKPSGNLESEPAPAPSNQAKSSSPSPIEPLPPISKRVTALRESGMTNTELVSEAKRTLRGNNGQSIPVRLPAQAEVNPSSRVPPKTEAQPPTLRRSTRDIALVAGTKPAETAAPTRLLRSRSGGSSATSSTKTDLPESKIPLKSHQKEVATDEISLVDILRNMGDNLMLALNTPPKRLSSQFHRAPSSLPTFVMRWVDYTGKYGLAYQLSNSFAGMYFNDSTSIILSSDGLKFDYLPSNGETISGLVGQHPPDLEKKVKLAVRYKGYMADNLHGVEGAATENASNTKIFLADFRRASNAVLFRMSDNVFQINFPDHSKVVLWDLGRAVRYVDKRGDVHIWSLAQAIGSKGEVVDRLKTVAKELFSWADFMETGKKGKKI